MWRWLIVSTVLLTEALVDVRSAHPGRALRGTTSFVYNGKNVQLRGFDGDHVFQEIQTRGTFYEASDPRRPRTRDEPTRMLDFIGALHGDGQLQGAAIDVGAHIGNHSIFLAMLSGITRVDAYEPVPKLVNLLRHNQQKNQGIGGDKIHIHRAAVGDEPQAQVTMRLGPPSNLGQTRVAKKGGDTALVSLDSGHLESDNPITLIKIDVEGFETQVLRGAQQLLGRWRPHVFVEAITPAALAAIDGILLPRGYAREHEFRTYNGTPSYHYRAVQ